MNDENPYESPKFQIPRGRFNEKKTFRILTSLGYGGITLGSSLVLISMYFIFAVGGEPIVPANMAVRISYGRIVIYGGLAVGVFGGILVLAAILIRICYKKPTSVESKETPSDE